MMRHCHENGALFVNSAIEDWLPDGWTPPKDPMDECMVTMHRELVEASEALGEPRTSVLVSMGCNPGNVSLWTKFGLDYLAARFRSEKDFGSYAEMAESLGVETIHVSEWDSQTSVRTKARGEYCNTWSGDSAAFYKEGMGPSEIGFGSHETLDLADVGGFKRETIETIDTTNATRMWINGGAKEHFRIVNAPGFETKCKTLVPLRGVFEGYVVRHDESFTINRFLTRGAYAPSVYYVY